jgi:cobalamin biosynthesis Co2+ chelatase CbiK
MRHVTIKTPDLEGHPDGCRHYQVMDIILDAFEVHELSAGEALTIMLTMAGNIIEDMSANDEDAHQDLMTAFRVLTEAAGLEADIRSGDS